MAAFMLQKLWKVTHVEAETNELSDNPMDAVNDAITVTMTARVSDMATFMSITWPHIQFSAFMFLLPFGWPEWVKTVASYVASLVSIDLG